MRVISKKQPGEYRIIHHLFYPYGGSVNDDIPPDFCSVHYATVDDAVEMIMKIAPGCAKTDVQSTFRIIPVHPRDYCLIGMHLEGQILCRLLLTNGVS